MRTVLLVLCFSLLTAVSYAAPPRPSALSGTAYGGNQPVVGAHVYLFSPGTTTGAPSQSLLNAGPSTQQDSLGYFLTTDSNGHWAATGLYTCQGQQPIYALARYGNPGLSQGTNNTAIGLMAYIGLCGNSASVIANINEVTTVALAYAIAGFATDPTHISYSGTSLGLQGIANAFMNQSNLVTLSSGTALATIPTGYATVPQATINTLANSLAVCVNTASSNSTGCSALFSAATSNGTNTGVIPSDTATAAINIAHNPTANISTLVYLSPPQAPFNPTLTSLPNDLTIGLTFTSGSIADAFAIAADGKGNVWVVSQPPGSMSGGSATTGSSVVEIASPQAMISSGTYLSGTGGFASSHFSGLYPTGLAVDPSSSNVWITTLQSLEEIGGNGVLATGSPFLTAANEVSSGGGGYYSVNLDRSGNVWAAGFQNIYNLSSTGGLISPAQGYSLGFDAAGNPNQGPASLGIDGSNNVWAVDINNSVLIKVSPQGSPTTISPNAISLYEPNSLAIDGQGNVWVANLSADATEYSQTRGQFVSREPNGFSLGNAQSLSAYFVSMDGAGDAWFGVVDTSCTNSNASCIGTVGLSPTGALLTGSTGYTAGGFAQGPQGAVHAGVAIDGSGNVWIANTTADSVTELIGAAIPVVTPLSAAVAANTIGSRP